MAQRIADTAAAAHGTVKSLALVATPAAVVT
jgi:hypothetical protein